jgi:hypothetical protein
VVIRESDRLLTAVRALHAELRTAVVEATEQQAMELLAAADESQPGDTIFAVDRVSEDRLVGLVAAELAPYWPLVLVAEGLPDVGHGPGVVALPAGLDPADAELRVVVDPIDGTRGLMYQKRSAWILTGVAPNRGPATSLRDIELAVQTEIPLVKQTLSDVVWAVRGGGVHAERHDRRTGVCAPLTLRPSRATSLVHGFGQLARFVPGARDVLAAVDDDVAYAVLPPTTDGRALMFEDQYLCTGGQLYELMAGHDRYTADVRPLTAALLAAAGRPPKLGAHPYDLCTALIATEAGVIVTDATGGVLDAPLDVQTDCSWVGYANSDIRALVEPALQAALRARGLL